MVATLDHVFREEWGRVVATLVGFLGDFALAEEAAQEALVAPSWVIRSDEWRETPEEGYSNDEECAHSARGLSLGCA